MHGPSFRQTLPPRVIEKKRRGTETPRDTPDRSPFVSGSASRRGQETRLPPAVSAVGGFCSRLRRELKRSNDGNRERAPAGASPHWAAPRACSTRASQRPPEASDAR